MASRTSTVVGLELVRGPDGPNNEFHGILYVTNTSGSSVIGGTDTLDTVMATAIQGVRRNGKTVTLRYASVARSAYTKSAAGVSIGVSATIGGTTTRTLAPTTIVDYSSNATIAADDTFLEPFGIACTWTEA